jgi:hypothetical protein
MTNHSPSHGVKLAQLEAQLLKGEIDRPAFLEGAAALGVSSIRRWVGLWVAAPASHGMVWARGHKNDFNHWAKEAGDECWGYAHVLEIVAGLVSLLLSDDSTYATGTTHSADGGFTTA